MDSLGDKEIAGLYGGMKRLDGSVEKLARAGMFEQVAAGLVVVNEMRGQIFALVSAMHLIKNDLERLKK